MNPAKRIRIDSFLFEFKRWAFTESEIRAVALVGSVARNAANDESDVDLIVIVGPPNKYLQFRQWAALFGQVDRSQIENHGRCTSLRVWYRDGLEVEFGFCDETWAAIPLDEGTREVVSGGMRVLFEKSPVLTPLL